MSLFSHPFSGSIGKIVNTDKALFAVMQRMLYEKDPKDVKSSLERMELQCNASSTLGYRTSMDKGRSFGEYQKLYDFYSPEASLRISKAMSRTNAYLLWVDLDEAGAPMLLLSRTNDDTFETPFEISSENLDRIESDFGSKRLPVHFTNEEDMINKFGQNQRFIDAELAVVGPNVYVFWADISWQRSVSGDRNLRIYFRASNDHGLHFGKKFDMGSLTLPREDFGRMFHIRLSACGNDVYGMWCTFTPVPAQIPNREPHRPEARLVVSKDAGRSFERVIILEKDTNVCDRDNDHFVTSRHGDPIEFFEKMPFDILASNDGILHMVLIGHHRFEPHKNLFRMVMSGRLNGNTAGALNQGPNPLEIVLPVYVASSNDYGSSFQKPQLMTDYSAGIDDTYILRSTENQIHIVWRNVEAGGLFFVRSSTDGGKTFQPPTQIPEAKISQSLHHPFYSMAFATNYQDFFATCIKERGSFNLQGVPYDSYFVASFDGAQSFIEPMTLGATGSEDSISATAPDIASDGRCIYLIWSEATPSEQRLQFNRGELVR